MCARAPPSSQRDARDTSLREGAHAFGVVRLPMAQILERQHHLGITHSVLKREKHYKDKTPPPMWLTARAPRDPNGDLAGLAALGVDLDGPDAARALAAADGGGGGDADDPDGAAVVAELQVDAMCHVRSGYRHNSCVTARAPGHA